jgi:ABC-2 type transport system ATP-binding protein
MTPAVRTEQLTKDFLTGFWRPKPHRALDGLSFEIPTGGVFGLLGPNGAGKSTTLKLLLNLLWPSSGRAEVLGRPPGDVSARRRLGFLPEHPTFYDHLTAEELLRYFAGLCGFSRADSQVRASRVLADVGLGDDRRRPIRQYSKGMVQRLGIAQALVNDPELVIFDEPMSGLDPVGRREVRELILRLRDDGRTILFSSHILSDAEVLCSRVGILSKGKLVAQGAVSELTAGVGAGRGWEVIMAGVAPLIADRMSARVRKLTRIADGRYSFELALHDRPEPFVTELAAAGASIVSITPLRTTLEDVFLEHVSATPQSGVGTRHSMAGTGHSALGTSKGSPHSAPSTEHPAPGTAVAPSTERQAPSTVPKAGAR